MFRRLSKSARVSKPLILSPLLSGSYRASDSVVESLTKTGHVRQPSRFNFPPIVEDTLSTVAYKRSGGGPVLGGTFWFEEMSMMGESVGIVRVMTYDMQWTRNVYVPMNCFGTLAQ